MATAARAALSTGGVTPQRDNGPAPGPTPPAPQAVGMSGPGWAAGPHRRAATARPATARPALVGPGRRGAGHPPRPADAPRWLPWAAAAVAAVVVAAVVLVVVLTSGGEEGTTTSPTTTAAPTTSAEEAALRGLLPDAVTDCASATPDGAGETARVECGAGQPGPTSVRVSSYGDASAADAFLGMVDRDDLPPLPAATPARRRPATTTGATPTSRPPGGSAA